MTRDENHVELTSLRASDAAQKARIAELEAEVARLKKGREWQPIKTAPRDGTWVLGANAWHGVHGIEFLRYNHAEGWCNAEGIEAAPTHWLPRPAPPSARSPRSGPAPNIGPCPICGGFGANHNGPHP